MRMIIAIIVLLVLPAFYIIYVLIAGAIDDRKKASEAKKQGITLDTGKPKYTYSFWSVLSGILMIIPALFFEAFKRNKRYWFKQLLYRVPTV